MTQLLCNQGSRFALRAHKRCTPLFVPPTWALGGSSAKVHLVEVASRVFFSALAFCRVEQPRSIFRHKSAYMLNDRALKGKALAKLMYDEQIPSRQCPGSPVTSLAKHFLTLHLAIFSKSWKIVQEQQTMGVWGRHLQLSLLIALCWKKPQSYQLHLGADI